MTPAAENEVTVAAPAKVNLYLHVVARRSDGYHLLDTLMVFTELADTVVAAPADDLTLSVDGPFADQLPEDTEQNLIIRAARALAEAAGVEPKAHISLTKVLPVASGLGSGSSDAAATIKALAKLWGISDDAIDLKAVGFSIGADVPACIYARPVFVSGRGEELEDAPKLPAANLLLVNPRVQLSTASVFEARRGGFSPRARFTDAPADVRALAGLLEDRTSDLTEAAIGLAPVVRDVLDLIDAAPGCRLARMSGSGATCFGLFDDAETAARAAKQAAARDWWSAVTRFGGDA